MNSDQIWLKSTAALCIVMLILYIAGIIWRKRNFDLNMIVPLLLGCAASIAAIKMIVLAFTLPREIQGTAVASLIDSGSIFVGGIVFFLTALYGSIKIVVEAFEPKKSNTSGNNGNGE
ncbi:hypothetical protein HJ008_23165 [Vibrio parahaemolyticus]|nr:hypothetical protein [Vibrio parahaemolyticus]